MNNDNTAIVTVTKKFPVSKEKLYDAWTNPEILKQWWRPMGKTLQQVENDLNEGGKVAYHFENDLHIQGKYKEVEEGSRLVYSWNWELPEDSLHKGEYLLTVEFGDEAGESILHVKQENFKDEHAVKPHQAGWEDALEGLEHYLSSKS